MYVCILCVCVCLRWACVCVCVCAVSQTAAPSRESIAAQPGCQSSETGSADCCLHTSLSPGPSHTPSSTLRHGFVSTHIWPCNREYCDKLIFKHCRSLLHYLQFRLIPLTLRNIHQFLLNLDVIWEHTSKCKVNNMLTRFPAHSHWETVIGWPLS